jgi:1-acyl-sn-glycerol-3-phosphate acyltransferase
MGVGSTLLVANHVSWLDILAINAARPVRFVSKADVRHWPLVGWIVACGGTLFIERERRSDAMRVVHQVAEALQSGSQIAIFPEGTTSDGRGVLPFHASLLQSAVATGVDVQPILMRYSDAQASISESANYVGDTTLAQSMWLIANASDLTVHVSFLPVAVGPHPDRRVLGDRLRAGIEKELLAAQLMRP